MQDLHEDVLGMLPYVIDNLEFSLLDLSSLEGERIEKAKKYILKARAELQAEGKERSSEAARRSSVA